MNVLCVIAHPDDEVLGCGGTLRKLAREGHHVFTCVLCGSVDARSNRPDLNELQRCTAEADKILGVEDSIKYDFKNIQFNVVPHLEMVKAIEAAIIRFTPAWIFTHHPGDLNNDHRVCYDATMAAVMLPQRLSRDISPTMIKKVFLCEILSSTDWSCMLSPAFQPNSFFDIQSTFADKTNAFQCFEHAVKPFPHSMSKENVKNLAHLRGAQVGIEMAEAFCLVRDLNL